MDQARTLGKGAENGPFFLPSLKYLLCYQGRAFSVTNTEYSSKNKGTKHTEQTW